MYIVVDKQTFCKYNMCMDMLFLLKALIEKGLADGCYPGAVAACGDRGGGLGVCSVGTLWTDGPTVDRQTRYDMASLTKVLSPTMLALRAWEEGELTLWDPLERFFDSVPEDKQGITVWHLMTHTAGFTPSFRLDAACAEPAGALNAILSRPLAAPPGGEPRYSCMGYIVLGKALETLYGQPLDALARERIFEPLGMRETGYLPQGGNIAATEVDSATGKARVGVVHDENARFLGGVSANAGVFSCVDDMCRFAQMLARGGDGFLSPVTLQNATRCHASGEGVRRGLGFHLGGTRENFMGELLPPDSFGHTGFTGTSLVVEPKSGFYAVLLTNRVHPTRENLSLMRFRRAFHNALFAGYTKTRGMVWTGT